MSAHFLPLQTRIPHTRLRLNSFLTSDRNKQHWAEKFYVDYIRLHKDRVKPHRQSLQASQGQTLSPDSSGFPSLDRCLDSKIRALYGSALLVSIVAQGNRRFVPPKSSKIMEHSISQVNWLWILKCSGDRYATYSTKHLSCVQKIYKFIS